MSDENKEKCAKKKMLTILVIVAIALSSIALILDGILIHKLAQKGLFQSPVVISKQYDKGQSMEKALKKEKPVIVWFYTDWCGYCQRFAPTFGKVTKDKKIKNNFAVAYVNAEYAENQDLVQEYQIQGFPTIYLLNPKTKNKVLVDNSKLFIPNAKEELVKEFMIFARENNVSKAEETQK